MNIVELVVFASIVFATTLGLTWAIMGAPDVRISFLVMFGASLFIGFGPVIKKVYDWIFRRQPPTPPT